MCAYANEGRIKDSGLSRLLAELTHKDKLLMTGRRQLPKEAAAAANPIMSFTLVFIQGGCADGCFIVKFSDFARWSTFQFAPDTLGSQTSAALVLALILASHS